MSPSQSLPLATAAPAELNAGAGSGLDSIPSSDTRAPPIELRRRRCLDALQRIRWDIDRDLLRGRRPDFARRFVPDAISRVDELGFLGAPSARALSQWQGCTYARRAVLAKRLVAATALRLARREAAGAVCALQAHVRVADDALKHAELFARLGELCRGGLPGGQRFDDAGDAELAVAGAQAGDWAALALSLAVVLAAQAHYRGSLESDGRLCPLWHDVFLFHWKESAQHAVLIELAWRDEDARLSPTARERAVGELVGLVDALDARIARQADADAEAFVAQALRQAVPAEAEALRRLLREAYRAQFVGVGLLEPRFNGALQALVPPTLLRRMSTRWTPLLLETYP